MARDYKNRSSRKGNGDNSRLTGLLTFFAGVVTGLCAAIIVYLVNGIPDISGIMGQHLEQRRPADISAERDTAADRASDKRNSGSSTPTPRFDFYTILPEMEVSVPEWESDSGTAQPADPGSSAETSQPAGAFERYILQIGSFRQPEEAERVKAQLALLGIETEIQRVVIDDGDIWHRVRAGPYLSASKLNQTRQRLIENDIDFMLLKLKQESG